MRFNNFIRLCLGLLLILVLISETLIANSWIEKGQKKNQRITILTHHKCASHFVSVYLKKVSELNNFELFSSYVGSDQPHPEKNITLLWNAVYPIIKDVIDGPTIHIIRNPLDIVVSAYYSHLLTHPLDNWPQLIYQRSLLTKCSKKSGFLLTLSFLEQKIFDTETPGPLYSLREWDFDDLRIHTIRMEDLVLNVNSVLGKILIDYLGDAIKLPNPQEFTFEKMSGGRRKGEIDQTSHYRSGLADCWRKELPEEIIAYIREHHRALLERYYPDSLE